MFINIRVDYETYGYTICLVIPLMDYINDWDIPVVFLALLRLLVVNHPNTEQTYHH